MRVAQGFSPAKIAVVAVVLHLDFNAAAHF
jgi:hypothetical protein